MKEAEIRDLESRLKELARAIGDLGNGSDVEDLIPIIHSPGWTTLPQWLFVTGPPRRSPPRSEQPTSSSEHWSKAPGKSPRPPGNR